jgi:insulysin
MIINKGQNDDRNYKYFQLSNNLKVLLCSHDNYDKIGVSLTVNIGSFHNNKDYLGLAHFLEHMVFMGSKKYPEEDYFNKILSNSGGFSNAYTDFDKTSYYFQSTHTNFENILDAFSRFFIDPLFSKDSVNREINAVDSEHKKNINDDMWRVRQLLQEYSDERHPFHNFITGDKTTLNKENILEELHNFYDKYYSADLMTLSIVSNLKFDELEKLVRKLFKDIPVHSHHKLYNKLPFNKLSSLNKTVSVVPITQKNKLIIYWQLPEFMTQYNKKIPEIICYLMMAYTDNSLQDVLFKQHLITILNCSTEYLKYNFTLIKFVCVLSSDGYNKIDYIISIIYKYIKDILETDLTNILKYYQKTYKLSFDWIHKSDELSHSLNLSENLQLYNVTDVISGDYLIEKIDIPLLKSTIEKYLVSSNSIIFKLDIKIKPDKTYNIEHYYNTKYKTINNIKYKESDHIFSIKLPTNYIPNKIVIHEGKTLKNPINININKKQIKYCFNNEYNIPTCINYIYIDHVSLNSNINNVVYSTLLVDLLSYELKYIIYSLSTTGNTINVSFNNLKNKLEIIIVAFNFSIVKITNDVLNIINNMTFCETNYTHFVEAYKIKLTSYETSPPYQLLSYYKNLILSKTQHHYKKVLKSLNKISYDKFNNFINKIRKEYTLEYYICGNITKSDLKELDVSKVKNLTTNIKLTPQYKTFKYSPDNVKEKNVAVSVIYFIGNNLKDNALAFLFISIFNDDFFTDLRTEQQLGYIVQSSLNVQSNEPNLSYIVQSSEYTVKHILKQIDKFLKNIDLNITREELHKWKDVCKQNLLKTDNNLYDIFMRHITELNKNDPNYNYRQDLNTIIQKIKLNDLKQFYKNKINKKNKMTIIISL